MADAVAASQVVLRLGRFAFDSRGAVRLWLGVSTLSVALGVLLNFVLTGGAWVPAAYEDVEIGGTSIGAPQYLDSDPYLVLGAGVLTASILLLLLGAFLQGPARHTFRASGFLLFGFYWATQAMNLYAKAEGDFVNMIFAAFAAYFFSYFAYHSLLDRATGQESASVRWLASTSGITAGVYFVTSLVRPVAEWLILTVAAQTEAFLRFFGQGVVRDGGSPEGSLIYYPTSPELGAYSGGHFPIQIILACTAIQSIMIFVGGIGSIRPPVLGVGYAGNPKRYAGLRATFGRRLAYAFLLTVPLIYVLNLFRNTLIIWMSGQEKAVLFSTNESAFWFSHNVIGKGGSLVALLIIAFIVFRILPELYDAIIGLLDLTRRPGPIEAWMREHKALGRRKERRSRPGAAGGAVAQSAPALTLDAEVAAQPVPAPSPTRET